MIEEQIVNYSNVQLNREENIILRNVNLTVNRGDFLYVIGKVGSGKSTLMKSMYAELPVEYGSARVFDYELASIKRRHVPFLRRKIGIVFQDFQLLIDRTVEKTLSLYFAQLTGKISVKSKTVLMKCWYWLGCKTRLIKCLMNYLVENSKE